MYLYLCVCEQCHIDANIAVRRWYLYAIYIYLSCTSSTNPTFMLMGSFQSALSAGTYKTKQYDFRILYTTIYSMYLASYNVQTRTAKQTSNCWRTLANSANQLIFTGRAFVCLLLLAAVVMIC